MKFVFKASHDLITQGLASTIAYCGHEIFLWNKRAKSTFDMFYELRPDYLIVYPDDINAEYVDAMSKFNSKCIVLQTTDIYEPFIPFYCNPAANPVQYGGAKYLAKYSSDILVNSDNIDDTIYIDTLFKYNKVKILGNNRIQHPCYLGKLNNIKEYSHAIKSTHVYVCGNDFERLNASLLTIDNIGVKDDFLPDSFDSFNSSEELTELIDYRCRMGHFDRKNRKCMNNKVFAKNNTFFHRVSELFNKLGHTNEAQEVLNKWDSIQSAYL
jgi:hypothetical protein